MTAATELPVIPCPPWCEKEAGHDVSKANGDRFHVRRLCDLADIDGNVNEIAIQQYESYEDGVKLGALVFDIVDTLVTPEEAHRFAVALLSSFASDDVAATLDAR